MSDPSTRTLSGREVVEKMAPSLQAGASESASFERALADYRQVVDQCELRTPEPERVGSGLRVAKTMMLDRVVPCAVVELPAAGHQPQHRGQRGGCAVPPPPVFEPPTGSPGFTVFWIAPTRVLATPSICW